jgi:hypothetical protein
MLIMALYSRGRIKLLSFYDAPKLSYTTINLKIRN